MGLMDFIYVVGFYLEVLLLYKFDSRLWGTKYTPINLIMIPYAGILLISIVSINLVKGFSFYYPSILVWSIGLLFFEIPSIFWAFILKRDFMHKRIGYAQYIGNEVKIEYKASRPYVIFNGILCFLFLLRFMQIRASGLVVGSEEFGEAFATYGLWGHLNLVMIGLTIANVILIGRKKPYFKFLICFIIIGVGISFLNQVKGWVLIPLIGGIIVRLKNHLTKLKVKLVFTVCFMGAFFFFMSYYMILVAFRGEEDNSWFLPFVTEHFLFYLTSGVNGFSQACKLGTFEPGNLVDAVTGFFYPIKAVTEILTGGLPPQGHGVFLETGYGESNVRTFFGDMYIRGGILGGIFLTVFNSMVCNGMLWLTRIKHNIFIDSAYGFIGGILFMGWFSSYTHLLNTYEVPLLCILLYAVSEYYKPVKRMICRGLRRA